MPDFDKRIVLTVDAMADVRAQRVVYKHDLAMDVYAPPELRAAAPVVLLVHGGPIPTDMVAPTGWGVFQSWAQLLAASGLIACVFDHRLHATTDYERSASDIRDAVAYVRSHVPRANPDQLALWYFSGAGPQLSWLLRERPGYVRCAVALYAMLDLRSLVPSDASPELHASATALSPTTHLPTDLPMLVVRAGRDSPMVNVGLDIFVAAAIASNSALDFLNHPRGEHVFECLTDDARTRDIIQQVLAFTKRHLSSSASPTRSPSGPRM
jgi:acetyl esterase/lipase